MLRQFIARFRNVAVVSVTAMTLGVAPLVACGVKGPLKLPPPAPAATTDPAAASAPKPTETRP